MGSQNKQFRVRFSEDVSELLESFAKEKNQSFNETVENCCKYYFSSQTATENVILSNIQSLKRDVNNLTLFVRLHWYTIAKLFEEMNIRNPRPSVINEQVVNNGKRETQNLLREAFEEIQTNHRDLADDIQNLFMQTPIKE